MYYIPESDKKIILDKYGKIPLIELKKQLSSQIPSGVLCRFVKKNGLKVNYSLSHRRYTYNENFFDIPNIQNSYWAGFIAADGCLTSTKNGVKISISTLDKNILENFKSHINFTGNIRGEIRLTKKNQLAEMSTLCIWGAVRLREMLYKHWNITPRKTYTLLPPTQINNRALEHAYLIGFFDGDGCWRDYKINGGHKYAFQFSGTESMMTWCKTILHDLIPEDKNIKVAKNGNYYTYSACGKRAWSIREKLNNIIDIPWRLQRKWKD